MKLPDLPTGGRYRILLAEDDDNILKLVSIHLTMAGLVPHVAINGLEAWSIFNQCDPHLVLTDITMPGLSGYELIAKVRGVSNVPIILMTAADDDASQMEAFKSGADDYVSKPFSPKILMARVIANLRRVYRYDASQAVAVPLQPRGTAAPTPGAREVAPASAPMPDDWSKCEACGYMGPQFKFQTTDRDGQQIFMCPHCKNRSVTFSLG